MLFQSAAFLTATSHMSSSPYDMWDVAVKYAADWNSIKVSAAAVTRS